MTATVRLASGQELPAVVSYTSAVADNATRTFRVEARFANPDGRIGQGMTAELVIPLPPQPAHHVSPSGFLLDDQGRLGLMIVDAQDIARFVRIAVLGSDTPGAWISGLTATARLTTVGPRLARDGERGTPVEVGGAGAGGAGGREGGG